MESLQHIMGEVGPNLHALHHISTFTPHLMQFDFKQRRQDIVSLIILCPTFLSPNICMLRLIILLLENSTCTQGKKEIAEQSNHVLLVVLRFQDTGDQLAWAFTWYVWRSQSAERSKGVGGLDGMCSSTEQRRYTWSMGCILHDVGATLIHKQLLPTIMIKFDAYIKGVQAIFICWWNQNGEASGLSNFAW